MNKLFFKYILGFVAISLFFISCDDDDKSQQSALFRPTKMTIDVEKTNVTFSWTAFNTSFQGETKEYELEFSETADFSEVIYSVITDEKSYVLTEGPIITNTEVYDYYVRVRAISDASGTKDSQFTESVMFSPYRENLFSTVRQQDLTNTTVTLRWKTEEDESIAEVTKIIIEDENGVKVAEENITDDEKDAKKKEFGSLSPLTTYTAYLYNGDIRRGRVTFVTRPENEIVLSKDEDLEEAIKNLAPGWIIRLKPGLHVYSGKSINISKSVTLESFASDDAAIVQIGKFALRENIGNFTVKNIIFDGATTSSDFIEFSKSDATNGIGEFSFIDTLMIEGCQVHDFSKSLMIYSATATDQMSIKNIIISNSRIFDFPGTTAQLIDLRNYVVNNIKITRSTFYNTQRALLRMKDAASNQVFELSNCTFYDFAPQGQYFIDFGSSVLDGGNYVIKNNILSTLSKSGKGYRIGGANSNISTEYSFNNEHNVAWSGNTAPSGGWSESKNNINLDPEFKDPANGNFKLGNSVLRKAASNGGALGDPNWEENNYK